MTLKGGTRGACAACKYQRRRCATDCPLAPYFPAEQAKLFQNVHRLFGVSSIVKILRKLDASQQPEAMKSIIFQSYVRNRSPVHGCLGIIQQLQYMIWLAEEELRLIDAQLQLCRQQHVNNNKNDNNNDHQMIPEMSDNDDITSQLDLGMTLPVKNNQSSALPFFSPLPVYQASQQQQVSYSCSCSDVNGYSSAHTDTRENTANANSVYCNQPYPYAGFSHCNDNAKNNGSNTITTIQSPHLNPQMVAIQQEVAQDYDEIHRFFDIIDDRQSFVDTKEAYASSSEGSLKDTMQPVEDVGENELRSAATCFSLTSVN